MTIPRTPTTSLRVRLAIRRIMKEKEIRLSDLGETLGTNPSAVSKKLLGYRPLTLDDLGLISERLGVTLEDLCK